MQEVLSFNTKKDMSYGIKQLLESIYGKLDLSKIDTYRLYFLDLGFDECVRFIPLRVSNEIYIELNHNMPKKKAAELSAFLKINNCITAKKLKFIKI